MIINFKSSNVCKIDSIVNKLRKGMSKPEDFTLGNIRDYIVDCVFSELSESDIFKLLKCYNDRIN